MLFSGPITEATQQANHTGLPQVLVVGEPSHHSTFLSWAASNHLEQFAIISVIYKGSEEEKQLDQVVPEKGIVPRVHIIPPQGRGLTPTCLYKDGFKEDIVSQAIATAGGIMMSYADVVETISHGFVDKELRNATAETQRTMQRLYNNKNTSNVSSPSSAVPVPAKASSSSTATAATISSSTAPKQASSAPPPPTQAAPAKVTSPPPAPTAATASPSATSSQPNVKITLRLTDGKSHTVYSNNLWNAATQLAKGNKFCLEMGKAQVQRAFTAEELQSLPITEGAIVRLNLNPPGPTPMSSPTNTNNNDTTVPTPASPPPVSTAPSVTSPSGGCIDIRLTLPTGVNQQVTFSPSSTLQDVRDEVTKQFLTNNQEMAAYCQSNGLSNTEFTLVVAYPPKKLENNPETNRKTLAELNLGSKFALRVVMAFLGGGSSSAAEGNAPAGGGGGSIIGKVGGWLRGTGAQQQ